MQPTNRQLLQAVRAGLGKLRREASGSGTLISNLDIAVGELLARESGRRESLQQTYADARALALLGTSLLDRIGTSRGLSGKARSLPADSGFDLSAVETAYRDAREILVACVLSLGAAVASADATANWSNECRRFFLDVAALEARRAAHDCVSVPADPDQAIESFDVDRIKAYFLRPRGKFGPLELLDMRSLSGGFSRQTILATMRDSSGENISVILRKQLPGGLLGSACLNLAGEIHFIKLSHAAGLPVAEIYWHETNESILGGEFIVMACLPGTTLGSSIAANSAVDEALLRELAQTLARLHHVNWSPAASALCPLSGLPLSTEISAGHAAGAACRAFERMWREAKLDPLPTLELILDWLRRNVPPTGRLAMISHGDIGFHNLMASEGHITGLIDWETARLADPAKDIAMVRAFVVNYIPWDRFMGWYREAGGPEIDDASLAYYSIYHAFTHLLVCEVAIGSRFSQAVDPALEYLQLGLPVRAFFAKEMLRDCVPIWELQSD